MDILKPEAFPSRQKDLIIEEVGPCRSPRPHPRGGAHHAKRLRWMNTFPHFMATGWPAGTCILFGDGAGAVLLSAAEEGAQDGMISFDMHSDGSGVCHLNAPIEAASGGKPGADHGGRSKSTAYNNIHMNGQEVFKFAVRAVPDTLRKALAKASMTGKDVDWLVMHQANQRILDSAAKKLKIAPEKVRQAPALSPHGMPCDVADISTCVQ